MVADRAVPAASGSVKASTDKDNGNTVFEVKVDHLARPASLAIPASTYLVWVSPRNGPPEKQGALRVNEDLKGEFKSVTVSKDFDLFITAEQSDNALTPSDVVVLRTHVDVT